MNLPLSEFYDHDVFQYWRKQEPFRSLPYQDRNDPVTLHIGRLRDLPENLRGHILEAHPSTDPSTYCVQVSYSHDERDVDVSTIICDATDDPEAKSRGVQWATTGLSAVYRDRLVYAQSAIEWFRLNLGDAPLSRRGGVASELDPLLYTYHTGREYHDLQEQIIAKAFDVSEESPFGAARLRRTSGTLHLVPTTLSEGPRDIAYLTPDEIELQTIAFDKLRQEFSDVDNDVFDILADLYVRRGAPGTRCESSVTDILTALGVNKRGGHYSEKRKEVNRSLARLQTLWLRIPRMHNGAPKVVESRALIVTDRAGSLRVFGGIEMEEFRFQMGDVFADYLFGPGRQTIRVSRKALQYHATKELIEKRLTRTLAAWARIEQGESKSVSVRTLLDRIHVHGEGAPTPKNPSRVRGRFEAALDRIQGDDIARWEYVGEIPSDAGRGWFDDWLEARLTFYFPTYQLEDVQRIKSPRRAKKRAKTLQRQQEATAAEVIAAMRQRGIVSERQAAKQIGISPNTLARFLGNDVTARKRTRERIREWLDRVS